VPLLTGMNRPTGLQPALFDSAWPNGASWTFPVESQAHLKEKGPLSLVAAQAGMGRHELSGHSRLQTEAVWADPFWASKSFSI
jgi:hypothetical protein